MFLNPSFFTFSKSYWRLHFSYSFCMPSTCCKSCGPTYSTKKRDVQFAYIFQSKLQCFFSGCSASCYRSNSNTKSSVTTWLQKRRPCPRNHSLCSVWHASVLDQFLVSLCMFKIYMKTHGFRGACPPKHCVRSVSRASSFPSAGHPRGSLDQSLGHLGTPWPPKGFSIIIIHSSIHASIHPFMFFSSDLIVHPA